MSDTQLKERSAIEARYRWNAESVFQDRGAWKTEAGALAPEVQKLAGQAGSLASGGPQGLLAFLEGMYATRDRVGRLYVYASMSQACDTTDVEAQAMNGQAGALYGQFLAAVAFVEPELLALGKPTIDAWLSSTPGLAGYAHYFGDLFRRQAHVRSAEVEEVLGLASDLMDGIENINTLLVDADLTFQPAKGAEVSQGSIDKLLGDPDREVRAAAWRSFCDAHIAHENTLAATLSAGLKSDVFLARVRRFPSSLDAALFEGNIPKEVFTSTVETFRRNLPVWHRYWKVRRKALKLDKLEHFDIWAPIAASQPTVTFDKAVDHISAALAPLGREYVDTLRRGCLQDRWVDVYPSRGKSSGAFSTGWRGIHPFVKMQYTDDLSSMSTLAHELGHSMHTWHTHRAQAPVYAGYSIFLAEVASNFNQAMVRAYLFEHEKSRDFQIALIEEAMDNLHRYFFIMPTLARFELEMHGRLEAGGSATAADMNELMADLFAEGYGGELLVDRHREGITWAQFKHLYMNFYVFQYATGISAAQALAGPILAGNGAAVENYLGFLSAGSSDYPVEVLRRAGADLRGPEALEKCFEVISGLVDRLEALTS